MLERDFFLQDTLTVAEKLVGTELVVVQNNIKMAAKIVETEAYLGIEDRAAHTFGGRRTKRNEVMYQKGGTIYVYFTYGMHHLLNFVTKEEGIPEAVLIRAVEPFEGLEEMAWNRYGAKWEQLSFRQRKNMTNGPGKLTKALGIHLSYNGQDVFGPNFYLREAKEQENVLTDRRVGIDYAKEAIHYPYRFFIEGNGFVSKPMQKPAMKKET